MTASAMRGTRRGDALARLKRMPLMPPRLGTQWLVAFAVMAGLVLAACSRQPVAKTSVGAAATSPPSSSATTSNDSKPPQSEERVEADKSVEKKYGDLQVVAPAGARVTVDGNVAGPTAADGGLFVPRLESGSHAVSVSYPGYEPREGTLTIAAHRTATLVLTLSDFKMASATDEPVELQLKREVGALHIRAVSSHPPINVFVNNVPVGQVPVTVNPLPVGSTQVRLVRGKSEISGVVTVIPGRMRVVRADMAKNEMPVETDEPMAPVPASGSASK
jgi:hypothetical protein